MFPGNNTAGKYFTNEPDAATKDGQASAGLSGEKSPNQAVAAGITARQLVPSVAPAASEMFGANAVLARENAARQSMIDSQRGGVHILGGGGGIGDQAMAALYKKVTTAHPGAQNGQLTAAQINAARGILSDAQGEQLKAQELVARGNETAQRLALDKQRLAVDQANNTARFGLDTGRLGLDQQRFGMEQEAHKGLIDERGFLKTARQGLIDTANSKDQAAVNQARMRAIAAGIIKPEAPTKNEYATNVTTNPMGTGVLAITRTNKDTGAVDLIDPATGKVKSFGAGGQAVDPLSAAQSAIARGADKAAVNARLRQMGYEEIK